MEKLIYLGGIESSDGGFLIDQLLDRDIIADPLSLQDSIYAVIDSQLVAVLASGGSIYSRNDIASARARADRIRILRELAMHLRQKFGGLFEGQPPTNDVMELLPKRFALFSAFPNPFNSTTEIRFDLPEEVKVKMKVYNILGQEVVTLVDKPMTAGFHSVKFDASHLASGVYVYRMEAGSFVDSKKVVLIR